MDCLNPLRGESTPRGQPFTDPEVFGERSLSPLRGESAPRGETLAMVTAVKVNVSTPYAGNLLLEEKAFLLWKKLKRSLNPLRGESAPRGLTLHR